MAYIISLAECISILLFTVKLLVGNKHVSRNPFTLLDCIGRMGRRCVFPLHVKLMPLQLLKRTVNNKLRQSTFIDGNCTVLVHASHLMSLRIVSGNWVKVKFLSDDETKRDPCVRWIRLYGISNIAKENCYVSSCLHNNLNITSSSDQLSMLLSDTLAEVLFKKEVQIYYMGVIVPKFLNFSLIPCLASIVHLSVIEHPDYDSEIDFEQTMSDYFKNPRLICTGDILVLDIQDAQLGSSVQTVHHRKGSYIYCRVTKISCSKSCSNCACHLTQSNKTKFLLIGSSQSRRIPCSDSQIDAEGNISIPPHLEEEIISIKNIMKEHFYTVGDKLSVTTTKDLSIISESPDSKQNLRKKSSLSTHLPSKSLVHSITEHRAWKMKPHAESTSSNSEKSNVLAVPSANSCLHGHVLVQGRAADVELLLHYIRGSSGYCFYTIECWKLKAETSGATEAKVLQAMQRSKAQVPAVFVLQGVDILVKGAQGEEDVRVTAALSRGLLHLSSRSVLVLATCEGHSTDNTTTTITAVPGGLWRLFSYQVRLPVSLGAVHREKLSRWFLLNKYSDFVEHTNNFNTKRKSHHESSEQLYEELVSLLTHRTVGYTYPAIDAAIHMACSSCASEFEEQNEPDSIPMVEDDTTLPESEQDLSNNAEFGRWKGSIKVQSDSAFGCCDGPLLLPRHISTALESLSHERKPGGAASVPQVHWRDVGALEAAKRELVNAVMLPLRFPHLVTAGMRRAGVLLYGPPGTGKTLLAKAVASECGLNFLSVKGPELLSMYVGQSELNVRQVFQRARSAAPCVIFFDELDALTPSRGAAGDSGGVMDRVVSAVVAELDECSTTSGGSGDGGAVFVLAATNRPDLLDPALLRPGRFEKLVYLGPCSDHASLLGILRAATAKLPLCPAARLSVVVQQLPPRLTGADLAAVATEAFYSALRRTVAEIEQGSVSASDARVLVTEADLLSAAADAVPSVSAQQLAQYETYTSATSTTSAG